MIIDELERRAAASQSADGKTAKQLVALLQYLIPNAETHLKQVIVQHPGFDIHDETHCARVVKNIESLMGADCVQACSVFELFLLVTAAYLHDCAMALPQWELNLLKLTEGTSQAATNNQTGIHNDLKPKNSFDEAKRLIEANNTAIFGVHNDANAWLFSPASTREIIEDLAKRLQEYQEYRNGFAAELRDIQASPGQYSIRSEQLRQDFVRFTHSSRIEKWVRNLDKLFQDRLGGQWGKALAHDLATVCKSHGEGNDFVQDLPNSVVYLGGYPSDLRLVAMMLRLGDIIHFTADRAPLMLFRQKLIASPVSRRHWEVKNEGIDYSIVEHSGGEKSIHFSAYFQTPNLYFLFQEYLNLIDSELALYNTISTPYGDTKPSQQRHVFPRLAIAVDRSAVRYDEQCFQPVSGMRFSLDQNKIINLLMGVKLYKNKFACLRELYQNAFDACRCMMSAKADTSQIGQIELGIGSDETTGERFLYCRDNGIGMTKEIVKKFLLNIGNSFYQSPEYQRLSTNWQSSFEPVSQFGIGILSCFMLGNRMQIVSKHMITTESSHSPICFMMDGPHEYFYYTTPATTDTELLGDHGTIVKVYLSDIPETVLNDFPFSDIALFQHISGKILQDSSFKDDVQAWNAHIYQFVSSFVIDFPVGIRVTIRQHDGNKIELIRGTNPFDYKILGVSRSKIEVYEQENNRFGIREKNPSYLTVVDEVLSQKIVVESQGVIFSCIIALPNHGYSHSLRGLASVEAISLSNGVLIDGILAEKGPLGPLRNSMDLTDKLTGVGVLNFTGRLRPSLSVDRLSIVEWPSEMEVVAKQLLNSLANKLVSTVKQYIKEQNFNPSSDEVYAIWEFLFSRFGFLAAELIRTEITSDQVQIPHRELSKITATSTTIKHFAEANHVAIRLSNYHALDQSTKLMLFAKFAGASNIRVEDNTIIVDAETFLPLENCYDWNHFKNHQYVFLAEEWIGKYAMFDIVTTVWPLVSKELFLKIGNMYGEAASVNRRTKWIENFSNGLAAISKLDPLLIHPKMGIYQNKHRSWHEQIPNSNVYRFEEARNDFWFTNIGNGRDDSDKKVCYIVFAFIAPRPLTLQEEIDIVRYRLEDSEYVQGVDKGWSILFLSNRNLNVIIKAGISTRQSLFEAVPTEFWRSNSDTEFLTLDGKPVANFLN